MNDLGCIGITMILRKMAAEPQTGWLVMKRELGGIKTAEGFATQVYRDALGKLGKKDKHGRSTGSGVWHPEQHPMP